MGFIGFSEETTKWFESYLSNRKFKVHIKNTLLESGNLLCGFRQGSILGPLLFVLYINNIPQALDCELLLYADDTCLIFNKKILPKLNQYEIKYLSGL